MLDRSKIDQLREQLKTGVRAVSAPQLFPTPPELARRMVQMAGIQPGDAVLEPSAGTGRIIDEIIAQTLYMGCDGKGIFLDMVELSADLWRNLCAKYQTDPNAPPMSFFQEDFLGYGAKDGASYDRIIMNPPFKNGIDIQHIRHALALLRPGGRLVALCAAGPRQHRELMPIADHWEVLPHGTFSGEGTEVNTALMMFQR